MSQLGGKTTFKVLNERVGDDFQVWTTSSCIYVLLMFLCLESHWNTSRCQEAKGATHTHIHICCILIVCAQIVDYDTEMILAGVNDSLEIRLLSSELVDSSLDTCN